MIGSLIHLCREIVRFLDIKNLYLFRFKLFLDREKWKISPITRHSFQEKFLKCYLHFFFYPWVIDFICVTTLADTRISLEFKNNIAYHFFCMNKRLIMNYGSSGRIKNNVLSQFKNSTLYHFSLRWMNLWS